MKISHIALACAVAFAGSAAIAQNEAANSSTASSGQPAQSASELGNKAKSGLKRAGDATKNAFNKLRGKAQNAEARRDGRDDTRAMGAGRSSRDAAASSSTASGGSDMSGSRQQRMDEAYANYQKQGRK